MPWAPLGFTKGYSQDFKGLTVKRNTGARKNIAKNKGITGASSSPYLVLEAEGPVPFFKWRPTPEAMAHAQDIDHGLRSLGLALDEITIPTQHLPNDLDAVGDSGAQSDEMVAHRTTLEEEAPASPDESISLEYQGNAVAMKMLPRLGKSGKAIRGFGIIWTVFIAVFTAFVVYGALTSDGNDPSGFSWIAALILIPFWMVGIAMLMGSYRSARKTEMLILSKEGVKLLVEAPFFDPSHRKVISISLPKLTLVPLVPV